MYQSVVTNNACSTIAKLVRDLFRPAAEVRSKRKQSARLHHSLLCCQAFASKCMVEYFNYYHSHQFRFQSVERIDERTGNTR
jgi:hypothetical protein